MWSWHSHSPPHWASGSGGEEKERQRGWVGGLTRPAPGNDDVQRVHPLGVIGVDDGLTHGELSALDALLQQTEINSVKKHHHQYQQHHHHQQQQQDHHHHQQQQQQHESGRHRQRRDSSSVETTGSKHSSIGRSTSRESLLNVRMHRSQNSLSRALLIHLSKHTPGERITAHKHADSRHTFFIANALYSSSRTFASACERMQQDDEEELELHLTVTFEALKSTSKPDSRNLKAITTHKGHYMIQHHTTSHQCTTKSLI